MIKVHGHRGFSELYPENTMLAFQKCFETGVDGIETDIRRTADGQFIILHDTTVDRTTNGTGEVSSLNWSYISGLDAGSWFGSQFGGREDTKIPTLEEFLNEYRYKNVTLALHLYVDTQYVPNIVDMVVARGMLNKVHFFGNPDQINAAKMYNANVFSYNGGMPTIDNYDFFLNNALEYGHDAVSINANVNETDLYTMIEDIKANNLKVHASYLSTNYNTLMQRHNEAGTDFILGNNPEVMQSFVNNYSGLSKDFIRSRTIIKTSDGEVLTHPYIKTPEGILKLNPFDVR